MTDATPTPDEPFSPPPPPAPSAGLPVTPVTPAPEAAAAPGWYPDGAGGQQYWDGTAWVPQQQTAMATTPVGAAGYQSYTPTGTSTSDDNTMAMLAHLLGLLVSFLGPLIIYLTKGNDSAYVKHHAAEALNFAITVFIAVVVSAILMIVLIGFLLLPIVGIGALVLQIMAAVAASRGEWYRYPINIRIIPGAVG